MNERVEPNGSRDEGAIIRIPHAEATANIRSGHAAFWSSVPGRAYQGRFTPIIGKRKHLIKRGDPIYAMGSCFAYEVEVALGNAGYDVLSAAIDGARIRRGALLRYNTPSMVLEFDRCLNPKSTMRNCDLVIETDAGQLRDCHLAAGDAANSVEEIASRRQAAKEAFQLIRSAKIIIITLGLNEVWFDPDTAMYLNTWSDLKLLNAKPSLEVRCLSAAQNVRNLIAIHEMLRNYVGDDFELIVSVSPVPLYATFSSDDVVIANMRSKSILRAAAEEFSILYDNVTYFPSYEIAMCSDLAETFREDDMRHVKPSIAAHIIDIFTATHAA